MAYTISNLVCQTYQTLYQTNCCLSNTIVWCIIVLCQEDTFLDMHMTNTIDVYLLMVFLLKDYDTSFLFPAVFGGCDAGHRV